VSSFIFAGGVYTSPVEFLRRKGVKNTDERDGPGRKQKFLEARGKVLGKFIYPGWATVAVFSSARRQGLNRRRHS